MARRRAVANPRAAALVGVNQRYESNIRRRTSMPMTRALNSTIRAQGRGGTGGTGGSGGTGG